MTKKDQMLIDRLAEAARTGNVSRRSFMHFSLAAGLTASAATGLWTTKAAAQPKSGGTFRWGIHDGNTSDTHDPGTYVTRTGIFLAHTHRSYLTMINGDGSLGPDLADSWEASEDASQWTFEIMPGERGRHHRLAVRRWIRALQDRVGGIRGSVQPGAP